MLWLAGAALPGDRRLLLWIPAVVLDLCAPVAGYWLPRRGRAVTTDYDIEGGHFTDRCQGFIIIAVGDDLLIGEPGHALHGVALAMVLGGPVLYLVGESLFRLRVTGTANAKRLAVAAILVLLAPLGSQISALALSATVAALLSALALWELRTPAHDALGTRLGTPTDAPRALMRDLRHLQQQQEGTS